MTSLRNPDLAAGFTATMALVLEGALFLAGSPSLLAQVPPWAAALVVALAAFARFKLGKAKPKGDAIPVEVDLDETPIVDLYQAEISDIYPSDHDLSKGSTLPLDPPPPG